MVLPECTEIQYAIILQALHRSWPENLDEWPKSYQLWSDAMAKERRYRTRQGHDVRLINVRAAEFLEFAHEQGGPTILNLLQFAADEAARQDEHGGASRPSKTVR